MIGEKKVHVGIRVAESDDRLHKEAAVKARVSVAEWRRVALNEKAMACLGLEASGSASQSGFPSSKAEKKMYRAVMLLSAHMLGKLTPEEEARLKKIDEKLL